MKKNELIYLASKCAEKDWSYDDLYYGDDLYGKEQFADEVWEYAVIYNEIGSIAFRERYSEYELY